MRGDVISSIPIEQECIARTFVRLNNYEHAQKYTTDSLNSYIKLRDSYKILEGTGGIFETSVNRANELLRTIEKKKIKLKFIVTKYGYSDLVVEVATIRNPTCT